MDDTQKTVNDGNKNNQGAGTSANGREESRGGGDNGQSGAENGRDRGERQQNAGNRNGGPENGQHNGAGASEHSEDSSAEHKTTAKENGPSREQELETKLAESNDKYLRLAAEFDNYRRRAAKERLELINTACEDVIKGLLPVLDDCERALEVLKKSNDAEAAKEGTDLIYNKLTAFLKSKGLEPIQAKGKELDTDFHEAVAQFPVEDKNQKGKIIDVVQQGYTLNGKVIRYAKVVVGV